MDDHDTLIKNFEKEVGNIVGKPKSMNMTKIKFGKLLGYSGVGVHSLESGEYNPTGPCRRILTQLAALQATKRGRI